MASQETNPMADCTDGILTEFKRLLGAAGFDPGMIKEIIRSRDNGMAKALFQAAWDHLFETHGWRFLTPAAIEAGLVVKNLGDSYWIPELQNTNGDRVLVLFPFWKRGEYRCEQARIQGKSQKAERFHFGHQPNDSTADFDVRWAWSDDSACGVTVKTEPDGAVHFSLYRHGEQSVSAEDMRIVRKGGRVQLPSGIVLIQGTCLSGITVDWRD